jgi:hypothetical protein
LRRPGPLAGLQLLGMRLFRGATQNGNPQPHGNPQAPPKPKQRKATKHPLANTPPPAPQRVLFGPRHDHRGALRGGAPPDRPRARWGLLWGTGRPFPGAGKGWGAGEGGGPKAGRPTHPPIHQHPPPKPPTYHPFTHPPKGERELQVLDYQNTAGSLLPLVAATYALWLMGDDMVAKYKRWVGVCVGELWGGQVAGIQCKGGSGGGQHGSTSGVLGGRQVGDAFWHGGFPGRGFPGCGFSMAFSARAQNPAF